jgi:hypothetical protein
MFARQTEIEIGQDRGRKYMKKQFVTLIGLGIAVLYSTTAYATPATVPEPGTFGLCAVGFASFLGYRILRNRKK